MSLSEQTDSSRAESSRAPLIPFLNEYRWDECAVDDSVAVRAPRNYSELQLSTIEAANYSIENS
jgi:hypothetical protein